MNTLRKDAIKPQPLHLVTDAHRGQGPSPSTCTVCAFSSLRIFPALVRACMLPTPFTAQQESCSACMHNACWKSGIPAAACAWRQSPSGTCQWPARQTPACPAPCAPSAPSYGVPSSPPAKSNPPRVMMICFPPFEDGQLLACSAGLLDRSFALLSAIRGVHMNIIVLDIYHAQGN